jgi:para-nitrobenzyl esterase
MANRAPRVLCGCATLVALATAAGCAAPGEPRTPGDRPATAAASASTDLGGTAWQLVRFEGGDGTVLTPDDRTKYTVAFAADGGVSVRFDCNRGRGTWKSAGPSQIELGPLALTRAMCPPGSLHDFLVKQWPFVRSYLVKGGHLFLSLLADGGTFELEPAR